MASCTVFLCLIILWLDAKVVLHTGHSRDPPLSIIKVSIWVSYNLHLRRRDHNSLVLKFSDTWKPLKVLKASSNSHPCIPWKLSTIPLGEPDCDLASLNCETNNSWYFHSAFGEGLQTAESRKSFNLLDDILDLLSQGTPCKFNIHQFKILVWRKYTGPGCGSDSTQLMPLSWQVQQIEDDSLPKWTLYHQLLTNIDWCTEKLPNRAHME